LICSSIIGKDEDSWKSHMLHRGFLLSVGTLNGLIITDFDVVAFMISGPEHIRTA